MIPLKKYRTEFWGQKIICRPMLLDAVIGDGKEWVTLQYMDDRPDYYVARVPTGTHKLIDDRSDKWYDDIMPDIEEAIANEAMDFYSERNWREHDKNGYVYNSRKWPIPPHAPCGSCWSEYQPSVETLNRLSKKANTVRAQPLPEPK